MMVRARMGCLIFSVFLVFTACSNPSSDNKQQEASILPAGIDFTQWNEQQVYAFLQEIAAYAKEINTKAYNDIKEPASLYEKYFSPVLSEEIARGLFVKKGSTWTLLEGDPGYLMIAPEPDEKLGNQVEMTFQKSFVKIVATYQIGLYSKIEYRIEDLDGPKIIEWTFY
jgi:hypothetical protein